MLIGPIDVMDQTIISAYTQIGLEIAEGRELNSKTIIGKEVHIGYGVEILGGVNLNEHCKIRSNSRVIGDVPSYGLAGGNPAALENYICPWCAELLKPFGRIGLVFEYGCQYCQDFKIRLVLNEQSPKPGFILLPGGRSGESSNNTDYNPRWFDDLEMRWRR